MLKKSMISYAVAAAVTLTSTVAITDKEGFSFKSLKESANSANWDATAPWKLPEGFTQTVVSAVVNDRPAVGRLAHEGIDLDEAGNVYLVDEHCGRTSGCEIGIPCGGGIYKFVPTTFGDLSEGELYVLKVTGPDGTGQGEWGALSTL